MTPTDAFTEAVAACVLRHLREEGYLSPKKQSRLLDIEEAAEYLGRTQKAVRRLIDGGKIPVVRFDARVQIDRKDLDRVIDEAKGKSA